MLYKNTLLITSAAIFSGLDLSPIRRSLVASMFFAAGFILREYLIFEEEEGEYEPVDEEEEYTTEEILLPLFKYL